jgi:hypothetical protein
MASGLRRVAKPDVLFGRLYIHINRTLHVEFGTERCEKKITSNAASILLPIKLAIPLHFLFLSFRWFHLARPSSQLLYFRSKAMATNNLLPVTLEAPSLVSSPATKFASITRYAPLDCIFCLLAPQTILRYSRFPLFSAYPPSCSRAVPSPTSDPP